MQTTETLADQIQQSDTVLAALTNDIATAIRELPGYHRIQIVLCARTHPNLVASYLLRAIAPAVVAGVAAIRDDVRE